MSDFRKSLGSFGEDLAAQKLRQQGLQIVTRNWRCHLGEIDIIAKRGDLLVIVEVKTRRGRKAGTPEQGVDARKQAKLCRLAQCYVENIAWEGEVRLDVVAVEFSPQGKLLRITHWPAAIECWDVWM